MWDRDWMLEVKDLAEEVLKEIKIDANAFCIYGSHVSGYASESSDVDIIALAKPYRGKVKYHYVWNVKPNFSVLAVDEESFVKDAVEGYLGEFVVGRLLTPYEAIKGKEIFESTDYEYKRRIIVELCKELVSKFRLASKILMIRPEYFLFEKLRKRASVYPPAKYSYSKMLTSPKREDNIKLMLKTFAVIVKDLVNEGILKEEDGFYRLSERFVDTVIDRIKIINAKLSLIKMVLKMYAVHTFAGRMNLKVIYKEVMAKAKRGLGDFKDVFPNPHSFLSIKLDDGVIPIECKGSLHDVVEKISGKRPSEVKVKKIGGIASHVYLIEARFEGKSLYIVSKKYRTLSSLKWPIARIWTTGALSFSVSPSTRMSSEIYFSSYLRSKGFMIPRVLGIDWESKVVFKEHIDGKNLLEVWIDCDEDRERLASEAGLTLAKIHGLGVRLGDCKPENFMFDKGKFYMLDLEQANFEGDPSWDILELLAYHASRLKPKELESYVESIIYGYKSIGEEEMIKRIIDPKYVTLFLPLVPPWILSKIRQTVKNLIFNS